jgi:hypothetical protein
VYQSLSGSQPTGAFGFFCLIQTPFSRRGGSGVGSHFLPPASLFFQALIDNPLKIRRRCHGTSVASGE